MRDFKFVLAIVFVLSGCSPIAHGVLESMSEPQRRANLARFEDHQLCKGYHRAWIQPQTKEDTLRELIRRGMDDCLVATPARASKLDGVYRTYRYKKGKYERKTVVGNKNCSDFLSTFEAQLFFIRTGGPILDKHGLDQDGDGLACEWQPSHAQMGTRKKEKTRGVST